MRGEPVEQEGVVAAGQGFQQDLLLRGGAGRVKLCPHELPHVLVHQRHARAVHHVTQAGRNPAEGEA